jgi:1-acyl-sn-glycerol-3-phosphate acyltransferase
MYWVARLWMAWFGWDVEGDPPQARKGVVIAAPHTTNWDLPHMLAAAFIFRFKISWLGKDSLFKPPYGWFMRFLGGLPVDRSAPRGLVQQAADMLKAADQLMIAVPPSGTRSFRDHWKSGFYWIAYEAQVPVVCGYLDYARKRACLGFTFVPTGDVKADMDKVRAFYADVKGKFPEQQSLIVLKEEKALEDGEHAGPAHGGGGPAEGLGAGEDPDLEPDAP